VATLYTEAAPDGGQRSAAIASARLVHVLAQLDNGRHHTAAYHRRCASR
jgi:hypothetical protein